MQIDRYDLAERFANMWVKSRTDAKKSQEYMAKALGVSRKTIQNWEEGFSCPSQEKGFEWFIALDLQPLPYYLEVLYPTEFHNISGTVSDEAIEDALITVIHDLPPASKRKLLYLLYGDHGSDPIALLELFNAYLQVPLKDRLNLASSTVTNYQVAQSMGNIIHTDHIQPDINVLASSFNKAKEAVMQGKTTYTFAKE